MLCSVDLEIGMKPLYLVSFFLLQLQVLWTTWKVSSHGDTLLIW